MSRLSLVLLFAALSASASAADWPQFRGSQFGVADGQPPVQWDITTKKNLAWQTELPGRGPSSPIIVNGRVIVTASGGAKQDQLYVICVDWESGNRLWQRQFWATGRTACHPISAVAAPTPASDGERIYAYYSSNDLICLDLDGNFQWCRGLTYDYPQSGNDVGLSSSPLVVDGVVVVQCENQGDSFAIGIDAETGETKWRIAREPAASWSSPVAYAPEGQPALVLLQAASGISAHDAATGEERWKLAVPCDVIPSPVLQANRAFFVGADSLQAVELIGSSSPPKDLWSNNRLRPGAASPIVAGDRVYSVNRAGVLNCADANTGELKWQLRLKGDFWATPVVANGYIFLLSQDGNVQVVKLGEEQGEIVAQNALGETLQASPAVFDDSLVVRSDHHLWRFRAAP